MTKFEYKTLYLRHGVVRTEDEEKPRGENKHLTPYLTELGMDGWELVSVTPSDMDNQEHLVFLKRPKD